MATIRDLHTAIQKCQIDRAEELASELQDDGVDISDEIEFANLLSKMKGGSYKKLANTLSEL